MQNRKDKGKEIERAFIKDVFPLHGNTPIAQLTRNDIKNILSRPLARGSKRMANVLLTNLKQFFGYSDDEELIAIDPTRRLTKDRVGGKEIPKERNLKEDEIKQLAAKISVSDLSRKYVHAFWLLLATGCRVNEIQRCKRNDIDIEKRILKVPDIHAKNEKEHIIYLSDFAMLQIQALLNNHTSQWLFPNANKTGPVSKQTITKQFTDRQESKRIKGRTKLNQSLMVPEGRWTSHDLRRTAASLMQEIGIMPHVIKKCLNQRPRDKMEEVYQRAVMADWQKEAFIKLGGILETMIS